MLQLNSPDCIVRYNSVKQSAVFVRDFAIWTMPGFVPKVESATSPPGLLQKVCCVPAPTAPDDRPHRRTRRDHETETAEDYVEAIAATEAQTGKCRVTDLAARFGVSHVTVIRTVARLEEEGLVTTAPYQPIKLTTAGTSLAERSRKRHEIVYQFLLAIGVDQATAALDAEGIEHHVSPATLKKFKELADKQRRRDA